MVRSRQPDVSLFFLILLLVIIGVVMVFSASAPRAVAAEGDPYYFLKRHALYAGIGLAALFAAWSLDYHIWRRYLPHMAALALATDLLLYVPGLRVEALGAARWVSLGGIISFQPSEVLKFVAILWLAHHFSRPLPADPRGKLRHFLVGAAIAAAPFLLILIQPDLGSAALVGGTFLLAVLFSGLPLLYFLLPLTLGAAAAPVLVFLEPYRVRRVLAFLNPWQDPLGAGFQTIQSLFSFASGGILGLGFGSSRQKYFYLPQPHTDFIYAVIGEELGFVGAALLVSLFALLAISGFGAAARAPDRFGMLLATLITGSITAQAFLNMAVSVGLLPITGIPLPLVSYGGTSLTITLTLLGILLNIAAQGAEADFSRAAAAQPAPDSRQGAVQPSGSRS